MSGSVKIQGKDGQSNILNMVGFQETNFTSSSSQDIWMASIGLSLNLALGCIKYAAGSWSDSAALMADGLHSLGDLCVDGISLFLILFGTIQTPKSYMSLQEWMEIGGSAAIGALVALGGGKLGFNAIWSLRSRLDSTKVLPRSQTQLSFCSLVAGCVSIAVKLIFYIYCKLTFMRGKTILLITERSDACLRAHWLKHCGS
jgi:divalent metal cation (Fe/Co/Zn/Cd) transporter